MNLTNISLPACIQAPFLRKHQQQYRFHRCHQTHVWKPVDTVRRRVQRTCIHGRCNHIYEKSSLQFCLLQPAGATRHRFWQTR